MFVVFFGVFFPLPCSTDQPQGNLSCSLTAFWFPDFLLGFLSNELCLLKLYSSLSKAELFFCKNHILTNSTSVTVGVYLWFPAVLPSKKNSFWTILLPPFCCWYFSNSSSITDFFLKGSNYCACKGMIGLTSMLSSSCILMSVSILHIPFLISKLSWNYLAAGGSAHLLKLN